MSSQKFTIAEAHRATGKSESTIRLHLKQKTNPLSYTKTGDGKILIDGSELMRRYPEDVTVDSLEASKLKPSRRRRSRVTAPNNEKNLEHELLKKDYENLKILKEKLEEEVDHYKELHQDSQKDKEERLKIAGLLEDLTQNKTNEASEKDQEIKRLKKHNIALKNAVLDERKKNLWQRLFG